MDQRYDVMVIGGGPAGLSGAVALSRARRSVLVVDAGEPRNAPAGHVHNFLTRDGTPPADLLALGRAEVTRYGGELRSGRVAKATREGAGFAVDLVDGSRVRARRLLVATGLVDELPDVPGLAQRFGRDVLHCPYCHGWEARDQRIGVLGTGPLAVEQANLWRQWSPRVTLLAHGIPAPAGADAELLAARGIAVVAGPVAGLTVADDRLTGVRLASGAVVELDALVVPPRMVARADVLAPLGLTAEEFARGGYVLGTRVPADPAGATTVPGVWVAGNVTDLAGQVVTSAAAGLTAAAQLNADLIAEDTRLALEAQPVSPNQASDSSPATTQ